MGFDVSVECERTFVMVFFDESFEKKGFLKLCQLFGKLLSICTNNKSTLGYVKTSGMLGGAVEIFSRYARF